jgi:hypothetical protein
MSGKTVTTTTLRRQDSDGGVNTPPHVQTGQAPHSSQHAQTQVQHEKPTQIEKKQVTTVKPKSDSELQKLAS